MPYPWSYEDPGWEEEVRRMCGEMQGDDGALLLALHGLMERFGYISEPATHVVAECLHVTPPQVFAVVTYYHEFRTTKPAETTLMLCRGPACRIDGMVALRKTMEWRLGITVGERTADGRFAIESSGCLGICPHAPAMRLDHRLVGRVSPEQLERMIEERSGTGEAP